MPDLQALCETGQDHLVRMEYIAAEETLVAAEQIAIEQGDFETLGRLYMPLQEARRQRRQRCGEGIVCLDLVAADANSADLDPVELIQRYPHGQLLIAGWGSIQPAVAFRREQAARRLFVETFLAAVFPVPSTAQRAVVIVPFEDAQLPDPTSRTIADLRPLLPPNAIVLSEADLPRGSTPGSPETYAQTMAMWERLHLPFLADADQLSDAVRRLEVYRSVIRVDYACELAHQKLSDTARSYARSLRRQNSGAGRVAGIS